MIHSKLIAHKGGHEGPMVRRQLEEICDMAQELLHIISDCDDLEEWVQYKIATVHDRLASVHSYKKYDRKTAMRSAFMQRLQHLKHTY